MVHVAFSERADLEHLAAEMAEKMAEREGFEPSIRFDPYDALAKRCFRPLSHLSGCKVERGIKSGEAGGVNGFSAFPGRKALRTPLFSAHLSSYSGAHGIAVTAKDHLSATAQA